MKTVMCQDLGAGIAASSGEYHFISLGNILATKYIHHWREGCLARQPLSEYNPNTFLGALRQIEDMWLWLNSAEKRVGDYFGIADYKNCFRYEFVIVVVELSEIKLESY